MNNLQALTVVYRIDDGELEYQPPPANAQQRRDPGRLKLRTGIVFPVEAAD